jgi:predicted phage gp36 major capsid-like protein
MPVAPDTEHLQELDAETRQAWNAYIERLRTLSGAEYERVESESWDELQTELRRLEESREPRPTPAAET